MFCSKCGKEMKSMDKFCRYCGTPLEQFTDGALQSENSENTPIIQDTAVPEISTTPTKNPEAEAKKKSSAVQGSKKKHSHWIIIIGIVVLIIFFVQLFFRSGYNIEYSNNSGNKLPIIVHRIEITEGTFLSDQCTTFSVENISDVDYKYARFAVLAWDEKGFPIKLDQPFVYSDADYYDYLEFLASDTIPSHTTQTLEYTFDYNISDVAYMSVFLIECEDFNKKTWKNPISNSLENIQGNKLDDTELYYFEFSAQ